MTTSRDGPAYRVVLLLTKAPALNTAFSDIWLSAALPSWPSGLRGYFHYSAQSADSPIENAPHAPYDAADELLFDSCEDAAAWLGSDEWAQGWLTTRMHLLGGPVLTISGAANIVWDDGCATPSDAVSLLTLPVRRRGMTVDAFAYHWLVTHAGLALSGPETKERLIRLVSTPADRQRFPGFDTAPFDGCGTIQFANAAGFQLEFASPHYREVLAPDEPRFTDPVRSRMMMVREIPVYMRP